MEHTNDLIFILNQNIEIEYINESAFKNLLGYLRDDVIGKSLIEFFHLTEQEIAHTIFNGNPQENAKFRIKDKNNSYHWYEFKIKIFIEHIGKKKFLIVARNITKVENIEERLNVAEEMFKTVAEQWLMGICVIQENQVKYLNQRLA
ncbi:MAG: PAS domain S-box protein, partial [Promethearchaeota archaeon]